MNTNRFITRCSVVALGALACSMVGCSTNSDSRHAGDINSIRGNPSPALQTLARRETDRYNSHTMSHETNFRMMYNDIDKLILFNDHPSHLTAFPSKN